MTIAILFARTDSIYKTLPDCDVWDFERNALNWQGGCPVVAHPPCRAWSALSHFAKPREGEPELALWSVEQVQKWGGVLEHPVSSKLWKAANLPEPNDGVDIHGGFTLVVSQWWWGHKADKLTRLYICGVKPSDIPPIPFKLGEPEYVVTTSIRGATNRLNKSEREATPVEFAKWLVEVARRTSVSVEAKL